MKKILFICHGNICRSPLAEFVFIDLAERAGVSDRFRAASAATSTEELGNPVYPPMRKVMAAHGLDPTGKRARQMTRADYDAYDLLIGMDDWNLRNIRRITGGDPDGKIFRLLDFTDRPREVDDPWYTREFERCYDEIREGCEALLRHLTAEKH